MNASVQIGVDAGDSLEAQSQETSQSAIEKAMNNSLNAVGTKVAYILLKQEALLLPDAYDTFCECFEEEAEQQNLPAEVSPNNLVTKQHLLSYLKAKLGKHLTYVAKIKSAGILLYRTGHTAAGRYVSDSHHPTA